MLEELYLNNLVIFESAVLPFTEGFNVISGETGAGKSLIAGAIGLVLGARANNELLRSGCDEAQVSAVFSPLQKNALDILHSELGVDSSTAEGLIFERRLSRKKASRLLVAGKPVTTAAAAILADALLDIAAQNEHTKLIEPGYQRKLLDLYGKTDLSAYRKIYHKAVTLLSRITSGRDERKQHKLELESIEFKLRKIADFAPDGEIDKGIEDLIERLAEAENIQEVAADAADFLYESEDAVIGRIAHILRNSQRYAELSPKIREGAEILENAVSLLEDSARIYRDVAEDSDVADMDIDSLIERAEQMKSLVRLLECEDSEDDLYDVIIAEKARLEEQHAELSLWELSTEELEQELLELQPELLAEAAKITQKRYKAAKKLATQISRELKDLGMDEADFFVELTPLAEVQGNIKNYLPKVNSSGFDEINFMITPNPGEEPSSIAETASGGEASRAMLAIKSALAAVHAPDTLLFDEIDTGVGGRLGDVLGRKLHELSKDRQVIVITHLPQIAAYADNHLQVRKAVNNGRTVAQVCQLNADERVEEVAQMINGKAATETTRQQAREMLAKKE